MASPQQLQPWERCRRLQVYEFVPREIWRQARYEYVEVMHKIVILEFPSLVRARDASRRLHGDFPRSGWLVEYADPDVDDSSCDKIRVSSG